MNKHFILSSFRQGLSIDSLSEQYKLGYKPEDKKDKLTIKNARNYIEKTIYEDYMKTIKQ